LSDQIFGFLEGISLGDLVDRREVQRVAARQDKQGTVSVSIAQPAISMATVR